MNVVNTLLIGLWLEVVWGEGGKGKGEGYRHE